MANKYAAIVRAAKRGHPLAQKTLDTLNQEIKTFLEHFDERKLVAPNENALAESMAELVVGANPWLQQAIDGRKTRKLLALNFNREAA